MISDLKPFEGSPDYRSPYSAALAVQAALLEHSDRNLTEDDVLREVVETIGDSSELYVRSIAESGHSIFYHQMQQLYEFARNRVPPEVRDEFCRVCGRFYLASAFKESIYLVLKLALARPGTFQAMVVETLQAHIAQTTGMKYTCIPEIRKDSIRLRIAWREPERMRAYMESFGLDADRCFLNSLEFIAGALEEFTSKLVRGQDDSRFELQARTDHGILTIPIRSTDRFDYETLIPVLLGYIDDLKVRVHEVEQDDRLESGLIADSALMRETWNRIRRASQTDEIVLLRGESGTGKSFIARKLHDLSPRRDGPFVEVGLTADLGSDNLILSDLFGHERGAFTGADKLKQGLFSLANGGTIFLDEVGDASPELQAKLLRVLECSTFKRLGGVEDIHVDVRVIAATNRELEQMVADGRFRQDLYYRLTVIPVILPPLRDRREDIPALAEFLLARARGQGGSPHRLPRELSEQLRHYLWPGNIRELDHALKHAMAMAEGEEFTLEDFPPPVRDSVGRKRHAPFSPSPGPAAAPVVPETAAPVSAGEVVNEAALRQHIRKTPPADLRSRDTAACPAHVDFAKRTWLSALIEECDGDLALISRYWDRTSEKTIRSLVKSLGLTEELKTARDRRRPTAG